MDPIVSYGSAAKSRYWVRGRVRLRVGVRVGPRVRAAKSRYWLGLGLGLGSGSGSGSGQCPPLLLGRLILTLTRFKIPNIEIDKEAGKFYSNWDEENKVSSCSSTANYQPAPPLAPTLARALPLSLPLTLTRCSSCSSTSRREDRAAWARAHRPPRSWRPARRSRRRRWAETPRAEAPRAEAQAAERVSCATSHRSHVTCTGDARKRQPHARHQNGTAKVG